MRQRRRRFGSDLKRRIVLEALSNETSKAAISRKYAITYNILDRWIAAYESGKMDKPKASTEAVYQSRIAGLEQMVGKQAMEIEFLKKALLLARSVRKEKRRLSKNIIISQEQSPEGVS